MGRRSREGMIWPQVSLAQMAALLAPDYSVEIVDAIATRIEETTEPFSEKIRVIAERSMYWNSHSPWIHWVGGHATIGIPVRVEGK